MKSIKWGLLSLVLTSQVLIGNYQETIKKPKHYNSTSVIEFEASLEPERPLDPATPIQISRWNQSTLIIQMDLILEQQAH